MLVMTSIWIDNENGSVNYIVGYLVCLKHYVNSARSFCVSIELYKHDF